LAEVPTNAIASRGRNSLRDAVTSGRQRLGDRTGVATLAWLTVLAALLRLPTLSQQSFWLDEGYTMRLLRMSFGHMLRTIPKTESTPYLYYAVAWVWTWAFGQSEYGVRSLSAIAGIATVPVVYGAARRIAGSRAAAIAALLVAVSPLLVWFSQEARAYALAALLSSLTVLCLAGFQRTRRNSWLAGWAASAALGLATHYFLVFVVAPELVWLWRMAPRDRRLAAAVAVVLAAGCALLPLAIAQQSTGHADFITHTSLHTTLVQIPKQLLIGYASPGQDATAAIAGLLVVGGAVLPLMLVPSVRHRARWPLAVGVVAVLVPVVLALGGIDFLDTRNLLPALPPLLIAAGIGFDGWSELAAESRRPRWRLTGVLAAVALAALSVLVVVLVDTDSRYQRDDWRGVAQALGPATGKRVVLVDPGSGVIPLQSYMHGLRTLSGPVAVRELDLVVVPPNVRGGGIGTPPQLTPGQALPQGFKLAGVTDAKTYTVVRLKAPAPTSVTPAEAAVPWLHAGASGPLVQGPVR
jgi:4-amino-4-deoxy-L-arabinose transferase-like glycosyltransferase